MGYSFKKNHPLILTVPHSLSASIQVFFSQTGISAAVSPKLSVDNWYICLPQCPIHNHLSLLTTDLSIFLSLIFFFIHSFPTCCSHNSFINATMCTHPIITSQLTSQSSSSHLSFTQSLDPSSLLSSCMTQQLDQAIHSFAPITPTCFILHQHLSAHKNQVCRSMEPDMCLCFSFSHTHNITSVINPAFAYCPQGSNHPPCIHFHTHTPWEWTNKLKNY